MPEVSNWTVFVNYLTDNQGVITFFELLAAVITAGIFIAILVVTKSYARSTDKLAIASSKSLNLTNEKARKDRTLFFIEKFDLERYDQLNRLKLSDYPLKLLDLKEKMEWETQEMNFDPEKNNKYIGLIKRLENLDFLNEFPKAEQEIIYFLGFFDTISVFYNRNELDKILFDSKLKLLFLNFFINFIDEITWIMNTYTNYENLYCKYENYLDAMEEVSNSHKPQLKFLEKNINKCKKTKLFIENLDNRKS